MRKFKNNEFETIYVLHTAFLGDIFISYYFLNELKNLNPESKIVFITTQIMAEPSKKIEAIDDVLIFDKRGDHKKLAAAKNFAKSFDKNSLFISLHKSLRSSVMAFYSNSREKLVWYKAALSYLFKNRIKYKFHLHERYRLFEFLNVFEQNTTTQEKPKVSLSDINLNNDYINSVLIFPGSVWATKKWEIEHFISLAKMLVDQAEKVLICGSKNEMDLAEEIVSASNSINLTGKFSLVETMKLVSQAKMVICNDSAPTHIANLFHTPVITIFGPTAPFFGFAPIEGESIYLEKECSPCNIHGPKVCPLGHHNCMKEITPEMVYEHYQGYFKKGFE